MPPSHSADRAPTDPRARARGPRRAHRAPSALLAALALAIALATAALASCGPAEEPFRFTGQGGEPTPLVLSADVPLVPVAVDEGAERLFLIDTGSPATLLDPDPYGLPEGPHRPASLATLGITALAPEVGVLDLFAGALSLGGILGGDLLRHFAFTLDYRDEVGILHVGLDGGVPAYGEGLAPATQVRFSLRGGGLLPFPGGATLRVPETRVVLDLLVEGEVVVAVLDTGASTLVLDEDRFDALEAARPGHPRLLGLDVITVDGARPAELSRAARVALADAEVDTGRPSIPLMVVRGSTALASVAAEVGRPVEALLGGSFLREFQVTIDYPAERLTLRRYEVPSHLDPREYVSVGFTWGPVGPGEVAVQDLFVGSDAEAGGVEPGDLILTAGGRDVVAGGPEAVQAAVDASELGDRVPFRMSRGGVPYDASVAIEDLLPAFE